MIKHVDHKKIGHFNHGWLDTYHHFSFADYYDPERMNYGPLRVVNDDMILGHQGFPKHPHKDMEIISYVIEGQLTHGDSMGHEETIGRGQVQYMSAGTGVYHSEYNHGDETVRLLQIWVNPDKKSQKPNYGDFKYDWAPRINEWMHIVGKGSPIEIHQDVNFYSTYLEGDQTLAFELSKQRQLYMVQIEGSSMVNQQPLYERDALEITESIKIKATVNSHILIIEMKKM